jgi:hypothetical protein
VNLGHLYLLEICFPVLGMPFDLINLTMIW